jgi:hypothetical protein
MENQQQSTSQTVSPVTIAGDDEGDEGDNDVSIGNIKNKCSNGSNIVLSGSPIKKPRTKWRKPEGKPHHPRTGYNFFFQLERERMLLRIDDTPITPEDVLNLQIGGSRINKILASRRDGSDQSIRPRALSGEKLGFAELARNIAAKWNRLDSNIKKLFDDKAEKERTRYKNELEEWNKQQKDKRQQIELLRNSSSCSLTSHLPTTQEQNKFSHQTPGTQSSNGETVINGINSVRDPSLHAISNDQSRAEAMPSKITMHQGVNKMFNTGQGKQQSREGWNSPTSGVREDLTPQWQNTERLVVSPPEYTTRTNSIRVHTDETFPFGRSFIPNEIPSPSNDISSKINQFIEDVCCVSEDLHEFAKITKFDTPLSPQLQDMEMQLDCCIGLVRRLSSQIRNYSTLNQQNETFQGQCGHQRNQMLQVIPTPNESSHDQYQRGCNSFDIPTLMNEVRRTLNGADHADDIEFRKLLENRRFIIEYESAASAASGISRKKIRSISDSNSVPASSQNHRHPSMRDSMHRPFQLYDRSASTPENAQKCGINDGSYSVCSSNLQPQASNGYGYGVSAGKNLFMFSNHDIRRHPTMQHRLHRPDRNRDESQEGPNVSLLENNRISHHPENGHRQLVNKDSNCSQDSRCFSPIDPSLEFCDDASYLGNLECDSAFDMESMASSYPTM